MARVHISRTANGICYVSHKQPDYTYEVACALLNHLIPGSSVVGFAPTKKIDLLAKAHGWTIIWDEGT